VDEIERLLKAIRDAKGVALRRSKPVHSEATRTCSFCGKAEGEVQRLAGGPAIFICNECLDLCNEIFADPDDGRAVGSDLVCSFCGMDQRRRLVAGPVVYICDECVGRLS
jgi:ribosomal protein L37AE/L43A